MVFWPRMRDRTPGGGGFEFPAGKGYARLHPCPLPQERENRRQLGVQATISSARLSAGLWDGILRWPGVRAKAGEPAGRLRRQDLRG